MAANLTDLRLDAAALYRRCDPEQFDFTTTDELDGELDILGQPRATEAIRFSVSIDQAGFNVFVMGAVGTGRHQLVQKYFREAAASQAVPDDWCYVFNFQESYRPKLLRLPAGWGRRLSQDMDQLVGELRAALSSAFEGEEYQARHQEITQSFQEQQESVFERIQEQANAQNLALLRTPGGLVFAPIRGGEVLSGPEVQALPKEERERLEQEAQKLQEELQRSLRHVPRLQREMHTQMRQLNREFAGIAVGGLFDELRQQYAELAGVVAYLSEVQQDVIERVPDFLDQGEDQPSRGQLPDPALTAGAGRRGEPSPLRRYQVNVLVNNKEKQGAPVIYEDNPTTLNLIGRVEHVAQMGALIADYTLIKPGALHRANGGYLILDARKVLLQPLAWESLKRSLQAAQVRIESPAQMMNLISTVSLEPEPIPLEVKVALVGDPLLYYILDQFDPEFGELFKVAADFASEMEWDVEAQRSYAHLIAHQVRDNGLLPFDRTAVARVMEQSARLAGDTGKLTTQIGGITDLLREASHWAGAQGAPQVAASHVQRAIDAKTYRADRLRERAQESILRQTVLIDTQGAAIGQVNGLSVIQMGSFAFGRPNRITAQVKMGNGEVVDIEREVELGGPIHAKGVLILAGFLGGRYGSEEPLSLTASLVFEQSYGGVEGDSASSAELYALLSAIAETPIKQSLAVTGSVNQWGQIQAIGGANEKIEGFFDICRARGLTGEQGVLIPAANVKHLMLRADVVAAVAAGHFHIYAVQQVDQGIELLTGLLAGERGADGTYPEDSINGRVARRLAKMAAKRRQLLPGAGSGREGAEV